MSFDWIKLGQQLTTTICYVFVGLMFFAAAFTLIARAVPFSLRKEIETDQNVALAILIGSVILGIALIVAAAIHGV
jgi:putative membrane protein